MRLKSSFCHVVIYLFSLIASSVGQEGGAVGGQTPLAYRVLTEFRNSILNWNEYQRANNIRGWGAENIPVCLWDGITCHENSTIQAITLPCDTCSVKPIGPLSPSLSELPFLQSINLQYNNFYGSFPPEWLKQAAFPLLVSMYLDGNSLTGLLPELQAGSLPSLRQLTLSGCGFEGGLPASWGQANVLNRLSVLRVANMRLNGSVPQTYFDPNSFPDLETLDLSQNQFTGAFPSISNDSMTLLKELKYASNQFTGGLPLEYGRPDILTALRSIDFSDNPLGGQLPVEWGNNNSWPSLRQLNASHCNLTGPPLPNAWPLGFPVLDSLVVADNFLEGPMPPSGVGFMSLKRLTIKPGNPGICGPSPPGLPFKLCDARDLTCALIPINLDPCNGTAVVSPGNTITTTATLTPAGAGTTTTGTSGIYAPTTVFLPYDPTGGTSQGSSSTSNNTSSSDGGDGDGGSSTGAIVGGIVGGVVALLALIGIVVWLAWKKKKERLRKEEEAVKDMPENPFLPIEDGSTVGSLSPYQRTHSTHHTTTTSNNNNFRPIGTSSTDIFSREMNQDKGLPWSDWEIDPAEIEIVLRKDGTPWELGSGSFGHVFKALRNGVQLVAVKIIKAQGDERLAAFQETRKEIAILRACRDANIVQFQGAHFTEGETMLITEYMEGGDLLHNVEAGRVTWYKRGHRIALDVAKGLVFLHSRRIVHFDLKSPNILLARDGTAKIADVGMAKLMAKDYVTGVLASLAWSAPEMLWGAKCSEKADIYSYGIVLWEICTGDVPERGRLRDIRVPEETPQEVRQLILECLDSRPSKRPSALQLVERLRAIPMRPPNTPTSTFTTDSEGTASQLTPSPPQNTIGGPNRLRVDAQGAAAPAAVDDDGTNAAADGSRNSVEQQQEQPLTTSFEGTTTSTTTQEPASPFESPEHQQRQPSLPLSSGTTSPRHAVHSSPNSNIDHGDDDDINNNTVRRQLSTTSQQQQSAVNSHPIDNGGDDDSTRGPFSSFAPQKQGFE